MSTNQSTWIKWGKAGTRGQSSDNPAGPYPEFACIIFKQGINAFLCSTYSTADTTVVKVKEEKGYFFLVCSYMAHDGDVPPVTLSRSTEENSKEDILIRPVANERHSIWASSNTNTSGEWLLHYILNSNLRICNMGDKLILIFPSSVNFRVGRKSRT